MLCSVNVVSTPPEVENTTESPPPDSKPTSGEIPSTRSNDGSGHSHKVMEDRGSVMCLVAITVRVRLFWLQQT